MAMNNELRLIGNIVKDPDVKESESGGWAIIRVAANTGKKDKEETLFMDVKLFTSAYRDFEYHQLAKGDRVIVSGPLKQSDYEDKEGNKRTSYALYADYVLKVNKAEEKKDF
jgi:single-strand DNA-binding protein